MERSVDHMAIDAEVATSSRKGDAMKENGSRREGVKMKGSPVNCDAI
jgi:hypothetical protein